MTVMDLNSNCYVVAVDNTSKAATLTAADILQTSWVIYNNSTLPVFVVSGVTQPTAVFPTSASVPVAGKVIGAGMMATFKKSNNHAFISAIQLAAGTGNLYISPGSGD